MRSLGIISHTPHYQKTNGEFVGLESTLREINHLTQIFDTIYHIAPLHDGKPIKANVSYISNKIIYQPIIPAGGKGFINKIGILIVLPINLYRIIKVIKKVDWIHFRAPTNLGVVILPLLVLYRHTARGVS